MSKRVRVLLVKQNPYVAEYVAQFEVKSDADWERFKSALKRVCEGMEATK